LPFVKFEFNHGRGTHHLYTGGFEIMLENWKDLDEVNDMVYNEALMLDTEKITEVHPEIFKWLQFLNIDMIIIIFLILVVSLINMVTSLLVMILEKTNMIGILKALGSSDGSIQKIFLYNSLFLLSRGLIFGNLLGIGLIVAQQYTGFVALDPDVYYLDSVPVNLNFFHILLINLITIVVCLLTLILPSNIVSRISPIKAIRFN
jgi:lipoprotein-releasing system permease protein